VGVGAVILDEAGRVLLLRRGARARTAQGMWACPGGALAAGETLQEAIVREVQEECGLAIVVRCQLGAVDHVLPDGAQWVSVAYLAQVVEGSEPAVREPGKCTDKKCREVKKERR
jgi:mutator protein MutT